MSSEPKLVHIVDDDAAVRRSVAFVLKTSGHQVETYESGADLIKESGRLADGCILLDIRMPGMDGLEVQQKLQEKGVSLPVIIMTGHGDVSLAVKAMKSGAVDFIEKPFAKEALLTSLKEGFDRLSRREATEDRSRDASVKVHALTPRERDVLKGLAEGLPNKTIAYDLGISPRTVEIHRANLMNKLGVRSLSEALRIAFAARGE
ncbi:MAG TPA: response regulator [Sphingomicrobium sp.]|nr:response regulator [Sphingomicrobium sp.]